MMVQTAITMKLSSLLSLFAFFFAIFLGEANMKLNHYYSRGSDGAIRSDFKPSSRGRCYSECMSRHFAIIGKTNRKYACMTFCANMFDPEPTPEERWEQEKGAIAGLLTFVFIILLGCLSKERR